MKVSEIFTSIQGEGPNLGKPAVFLRLALCNLACDWCDTKYTWDWKHFDYDAEVKEMSLETVEERVQEPGVKHLVLTGGEPLLQQADLVPLLSFLKRKQFYVEVETNGTIEPTPEMISVVDQWNVSPKLENSKNPTRVREKPQCYQVFNSLSSSIFKYVIQNPADFEEINQLAQRYHIARRKIMLMPEAQTREELSERSKWLTDLCRKQGYRFSPRLHVALWGVRRGV